LSTVAFNWLKLLFNLICRTNMPYLEN